MFADQRTTWLAQFAHVLHIRPWEIGQLPVPEFRQLVEALKDYNRKDEE